MKKKYTLSKTDKSEISGLLVFLSGALRTSPVKSIKFERFDKHDQITVERYDTELLNTFSTFKIKKSKP